MKSTTFRVILVIAAMMLIGAASVSAGNYVSWGGGFHVVMPDSWKQVDYQTVDAFLISNRAGRDVLDYDAVFAPSESAPFFVGNYLIVTIDTVGQLTKTQIDSVLGDMGTTFGQEVKYFPVSDFLADMKSNAPSYDADKKLVTVVNDIVIGDKVTKKLMLMTKFYDKGLATFYYYSPDSLFEQSKHVVSEIVQSFSTENLDDAAGKADVKVADVVVEKKEESDDDDGSNSTTNWVPYTGMVVILIAVIARKRRKARQKQQDSNKK